MNIRPILIFILSLLTFSCSDISEDERLIYVEPISPEPLKESRRVLLEDFTGQRCVNCPNASDEISLLQSEYGSDNVIAVGIHSGPLAFYSSNNLLGLRTSSGDIYYDHWGLEYQPVGLVNRRGPFQPTLWHSRVRDALQETSNISILCTATLSTPELIQIETTVKGLEGTTNGYLQLWLVEDKVKAFQFMPDNSMNRDYVHNHVFRSPINGQWGEEISVSEDVSITKEHSISVDDAWNVSNLSVIAFVYNKTGVEQVTRTQLK